MSLDPNYLAALTSAFILGVLCLVWFWALFVYWVQRVFAHLGRGRVGSLLIRGARFISCGTTLFIGGLLFGVLLTTVQRSQDFLLIRLVVIFSGLTLKVVGVYYLCKAMERLRTAGRAVTREWDGVDRRNTGVSNDPR